MKYYSSSKDSCRPVYPHVFLSCVYCYFLKFDLFIYFAPKGYCLFQFYQERERDKKNGESLEHYAYWSNPTFLCQLNTQSSKANEEMVQVINTGTPQRVLGMRGWSVSQFKPRFVLCFFLHFDSSCFV